MSEMEVQPQDQPTTEVISGGRGSPVSQQSRSSSGNTVQVNDGFVVPPTAPPRAKHNKHHDRKRSGEWEIMQGLRQGEPCPEQRPIKFEGYLLKRRKWPLKGWHRRFFYLDKGTLVYAKTSADMARGRTHGTIDLGVSFISTKPKGHRIDIDAEEFIYHLKVKDLHAFDQWCSQLKTHRLWRQYELTQGATDIQAHSIVPKTDGSHHSRVAAWILDSPALSDKELEHIQERLSHLNNILHLAEGQNANSVVPVSADDTKKKRFHLKKPSVLKSASTASKASHSAPKSPVIPIPKPTHHGGSTENINTSDDHSGEEGGQLLSTSQTSSNLSASNPTLCNANEGGADTPEPGAALFLEDFITGAREVMMSLHNLSCAVKAERERLLQQATDHDRHVEALKASLSSSEALNVELRDRLSKIRHLCGSEGDTSANATPSIILGGSGTLPRNGMLVGQQGVTATPVSISGQPVTSVVTASTPTAKRVLQDTSSILSITEYFDAAENLSSASSSSEVSDNESLCSEISDDGTEYAAGNDAQPVVEGARTRRTKLPVPKPEGGDQSLWSLLCKNIGKDLSKVSMPVTLNEPLGMLQRLCEELEYSELLDKAADTKDHFERMVHVAAFAVSGYSSSYHRAGHKPFNSLLGETYECIREDKGFKFVAEQVQHHPPISACHAVSAQYEFWQDVRIKTKFWGKSMEIMPIGTVHVRFPGNGSHYQWNKVTTCVHNLFSTGQRWVDQYGEMSIKDVTNGVTCKLTFVKASYWSEKKHEVFGSVSDSKGKVVHHLFGQWTAGLYCGVASTARCVWRPGQMPPDHEKYYGFSQFAIELNELDPLEAPLLPPTDSRFRPDQRLLEDGKVAEAERAKALLEQAQRDRRVQRDNRGQIYQPMWFRCETDKKGANERWEFGGEYWEKRENPGFRNMEFKEKLWDMPTNITGS